jgi:drug/metabolite transporter (DMT)-like permease
MNALLLGAVAAFGWGLYDFLIRFVSRSGAGSLQAILLVLVFGVATLGTAALITGQEISMPRGEFWPVAVSGATYAAGLVTGYRAFAIGPISFVAPIVAAYPVFTILWAVANGARPSLAEWLGVASILIGVALVARFAADQPAEETPAGSRPSRGAAFLYSAMACVGFAASFAAGQLAAQTAPELDVTFFARLWALALVLPISLRSGLTIAGARTWLPLLMLMGAIDAVCLLAVNAAGKMDGAEYAVVIASTFGLVTVALAIVFLRERLSLLQVVGIALVFSGVVALSGSA